MAWNTYRVLILAVLFLVGAASDALADHQARARGLLITSYHQGDAWNDGVVRGIQDILEPLGTVELAVEFRVVLPRKGDTRSIQAYHCQPGFSVGQHHPNLPDMRHKGRIGTIPQGIDPSLEQILGHLLENRGIDFSGYHPAMLERRVRQHLRVAECGDFDGYRAFLLNNPGEIDNLLDAITINVSRFFRDTLTFELIADQILPTLAREKMHRNETSLRIWSAGCARGEEPYSMAILIRELQEKEGWPEHVHFFATDIDPKALDAAGKAQYAPESLKNVKFRLLNKYFSRHGEVFALNPEIRKIVAFSHYDLLDKSRGVPPESVFGDFDLVLCRNVLIYFNLQYQARIFERLYRALNPNGFLVLGMAETPPEKFHSHFERIFAFSPIHGRR